MNPADKVSVLECLRILLVPRGHPNYNPDNYWRVLQYRDVNGNWVNVPVVQEE